MWGGYIIVGLIVFLITSLVVSVAWIRVTRRYARLSSLKFQEYESMLSDKIKLLQDQEKTIEEKTEAIRELFHQVNHKWARPAMASVLGLLNLYSPDSKNLGENLILLSRPNHHRYGSLAIKQKTRMDECIQKLETICRELHKNSVESVKKFEHLQE